MDSKEVSDYFVRHGLWPAILFIALVAVFGAVGNGLVVYVYWNEYNKSVTILLIFFLSAIDFCASFMALPNHMIPLMRMVSYPSLMWCKMSRYLDNLLYECSCFTYMVIAFSRYDKLYRLTNPWLTLERGRLLCFGVFIFAFLINLPSLFFYTLNDAPVMITDNVPVLITHSKFDEFDIRPIDTGSHKLSTMNPSSNGTTREFVVGQICQIESTDFRAVTFYGLQFLFYLILMLLIIYFYTKVAQLIRIHREHREIAGRRASRAQIRKSLYERRKSKFSVPKTQAIEIPSRNPLPDSSTDVPEKADPDGSIPISETEIDDCPKKTENGKRSFGGTAGRKSSAERRERTDFKKTRMDVKLASAERISNLLLCVSLVFIFSYIPYWVIVLWISNKGDVLGLTLNSQNLGIVAFFYRSAQFNHVANPIMYWLLNRDFRSRCKVLCGAAAQSPPPHPASQIEG